MPKAREGFLGAHWKGKSEIRPNAGEEFYIRVRPESSVPIMDGAPPTGGDTKAHQIDLS